VGCSEAAFAFGVHFCRTTHPHLPTVKDGHLIKSRRLIPSKSLSQTPYSSHRRRRPNGGFYFYSHPRCETPRKIYRPVLQHEIIYIHIHMQVYYMHAIVSQKFYATGVCIYIICIVYVRPAPFLAITLRIIVGILCTYGRGSLPCFAREIQY